MAIVRAEAPIGMGGLRFGSALTGEAGPGVAQPPPAATERARELIARAGSRHPLDPRPAVSIAHLDLAQRMFAHAERGYRRALVLAPHFGEARLGLGVSLALRAEREADPLERRSLRLQAVAQFAAVPQGDPLHAHALYDRATLLATVGRHAEAEARALEYLRGDPGSPWADSLASRLGLPRPLEVRARSG
jgi:tetratricopeptide (TPR) repeat protein